MSVSDTATNPTARVELELLRQRNAELEEKNNKLMMVISDLSSENFNLNCEVSKLRKCNEEHEIRIEELEKSREDTHAENVALKSKVENVESRIANVEQGSPLKDGQPQVKRVSDKVIEQAQPRGKNQTLESSAQDSTSKPRMISDNKEEIGKPVSQGYASDNKEKIGKPVSQGYASDNKEKIGKLVSQGYTSEEIGKPVSQGYTSEKIGKPVSQGYASDNSESLKEIETAYQDKSVERPERPDIVTEFVQGLLEELLSSDDPLQTIKFSSPKTSVPGSISIKILANSFCQANGARNRSITAKREEITAWRLFSERFEDKVAELRSNDKKLTDQTARKRIYNEMKPYLAGISDEYLRVRASRARKINKLFGFEYDPVTLKKIDGIPGYMVNRVTCSADRISKLTNPQIEYIIDQVKSKTIADQSRVNVTSETMANTSAKVDEPEVVDLDLDSVDDCLAGITEEDLWGGEVPPKVFDDVDFDDEILYGTPALPVDLNHPINARSEVSVHS